jgi:hypothetical protein
MSVRCKAALVMGGGTGIGGSFGTGGVTARNRAELNLLHENPL